MTACRPPPAPRAPWPLPTNSTKRLRAASMGPEGVASAMGISWEEREVGRRDLAELDRTPQPASAHGNFGGGTGPTARPLAGLDGEVSLPVGCEAISHPGHGWAVVPRVPLGSQALSPRWGRLYLSALKASNDSLAAGHMGLRTNR
jgi:hypothetical protein